MKVEFNLVDLDMRKKGIVKLRDAAGVTIACREGAIWVTLDNDPRDIVLEPGESFTGAEHRPAMIYALQPSSLALSAPPAVGHGLREHTADWTRRVGAWARSSLAPAAQVST